VEQSGDGRRLAAGHRQQIAVGDDPRLADLADGDFPVANRSGALDGRCVFLDVALNRDDARSQ